MTNRFDYWQQSLMQRDSTLVILAAIAISLVLAWMLGRRFLTNRWVSLAALLLGAGLYILTICVTVL